MNNFYLFIFFLISSNYGHAQAGRIGVNINDSEATVHIRPFSTETPLVIEGVNMKELSVPETYYSLVISDDGTVEKVNFLNFNTSVVNDLSYGLHSIALGSATGIGGTWLDFGNIILPEDGSYIFSYRIYGTFVHDAIFSTFYLSLFRDSEIVPYDIIEIALTNTENGRRSTYTGQLTVTGKKGTVVKSKMGASDGRNPLILSGDNIMTANKTTLLYWKV